MKKIEVGILKHLVIATYSNLEAHQLSKKLRNLEYDTDDEEYSLQQQKRKAYQKKFNHIDNVIIL